ncbi:MAG TPA: hypothetical protein VD999_03235 [Vitreimonas sp.]|nr:hypothetical protein [Vitreimonas sp.]
MSPVLKSDIIESGETYFQCVYQRFYSSPTLLELRSALASALHVEPIQPWKIHLSLVYGTFVVVRT